MSLWVKYVPCKSEDLSLDSQNPGKEGMAVYLQPQLSYRKIREAETTESWATYPLLGSSQKETVSNKVEGKLTPRLSSDLHMCSMHGHWGTIM